VQLCKSIFILTAATFALSACSRDGELDSSGGVVVTRSTCPAIAIPAFTGDMTMFNPPSSRDSRAIDVVATITNLRTTCTETGTDVVSTVTFDVLASRMSGNGAREVILPYFASVVQGGRVVVSKSISRVAVRFADGALRATTTGTATGTVNRAAATLPPAIQEKITRRRKAGDLDAASDPFADPDVKAAVARASFELLIGFQLSQDQLQYNATR
jgi:hypothetical protein